MNRPTEDTPTNKKPTRDEPSVGAANTIIQDDQQLREEVGRLLLELIRGKGAVLATEDQILALFHKEQLQLVSELLEHSREYEVTDLEKLDHWNETPLLAIPASVLEHKKQELEKGKP